jgi:hypothetical protein
MSDIDFALNEYEIAKSAMQGHQENEPIGLQYDKEDKYIWAKDFKYFDYELNEAKRILVSLLDEELDEYMKQNKPPTIVENWNKKAACLLLKGRLGLHFSVSIKELFLYVGCSVMCIPDQYKNSVVNGFAHALDEWANVDIDELRAAMNNIGTKMEERCYHCNELMPEFEGTGHAICHDCA